MATNDGIIGLNEIATPREHIGEDKLSEEFTEKVKVSSQEVNTDKQDLEKRSENLLEINRGGQNESKEVENKLQKVFAATSDEQNSQDKVYKYKHKIGSRKASGNVITYNEPMFQSFVSSMFEKLKEPVALKPKHAENKRSRSLGNSPVKQSKVDFSRSYSFESGVNVKKKNLETDFSDCATSGMNSEKDVAVKKQLIKKKTNTKKANEKKAIKVVTENDKNELKNQKGDLRNTQVSDEFEPKQKKKQQKQGDDSKRKKKVDSSSNTKIKDHEILEKKSNMKPAVAQRRTKREASLNAVTFMNLLYVKEGSPPAKPVKLPSKRSKSETDIIKEPKKQKTSSGSATLSSIEQTINEVVQNIRAEVTINDVIERIRAEAKSNESADLNDSHAENVKQSLADQNLADEVFHKDKFDLIKIKADKQKERKQGTARLDKTDKKVAKKAVEKNTNEEIAEKKRKANLARLKKAKEILQQGKLKTQQQGTGSNKERELLNMKLTKLSVILKRKQKIANKRKDGLSTKGVTDSKDKLKLQKVKRTKKSVKDSETKENKIKRKNKTESESCRSARTHVETPKRVIRPSSCQCCQSYYQNQGSSYWNNRNVVNRGPYSQDSYQSNLVNRGSYTQEPSTSTEQPPSTSVEIHPYSSPVHVPVVDNNPFVGQMVPAHIPQCNSCTCIHGAILSAPCPQCTVGGMPVLTCHHQGFSSAYPVTFSHNHGSYSHCACTYCTNGSFHASSNPMIHQTITAETPFLLRHPVPLQLPHDSNHPLSVQLSHGERPPPLQRQITHGEVLQHQVPHGEVLQHQVSHGEVHQHQVSHGEILQHQVPHAEVLQHQVAHGEVNPMHLSHVYNMPHHELTVSAATPTQTEHELIDVGQEDFVANGENVKKNSGSDQTKVENAKAKTVSDITKKQKSKDLKDSEAKSKISKPKRLNSIIDKLKSKSENTKVKRKKSEVDTSSEKKVKKETGVKQKDKAQKEDVGDGKKKDGKKKERKKSGGNKEKVQKSVSVHGWVWEGEPEIRTVNSIFDGKPVVRKFYKAIKHDDGDIIETRDCILVCSGSKKDNPYVAKVTSFWEEPNTGEMMMTLLWYYRPEHTEAGRQPYHKDCEVFAAKHRDESLVACIDDKCYVLTYNEYCRFMAEVARTKYSFFRKQVIPDPEEPYPSRRIPPVDIDPENVLLCRHVYDFKLKRVLKNPS